MAYANITFRNPMTHETKVAPVGFSWTTLFFGIFPALIRGDWKWGVIMFLISWVTFGLSLLVFPFIYNKIYLKDLIGKGFQALASDAGDVTSLGYAVGLHIPVASA